MLSGTCKHLHPNQLEAPPLRALHQSLHQPLLYPLWLHSNQGLLLGPGRPYSTRVHQQASKGWPHNLQTTFEGKKVNGGKNEMQVAFKGCPLYSPCMSLAFVCNWCSYPHLCCSKLSFSWLKLLTASYLMRTASSTSSSSVQTFMFTTPFR